MIVNFDPNDAYIAGIITAPIVDKKKKKRAFTVSRSRILPRASVTAVNICDFYGVSIICLVALLCTPSGVARLIYARFAVYATAALRAQCVKERFPGSHISTLLSREKRRPRRNIHETVLSIFS